MYYDAAKVLSEYFPDKISEAKSYVYLALDLSSPLYRLPGAF
jgi:hypothetical protein